MADEGKRGTGKPPAAPPAAKKGASEKKPASYAVAEGRSITTGGRIIGPGGAITADDVADIEALVKGGFVVKA